MPGGLSGGHVGICGWANRLTTYITIVRSLPSTCVARQAGGWKIVFVHLGPGPGRAGSVPNSVPASFLPPTVAGARFGLMQWTTLGPEDRSGNLPNPLGYSIWRTRIAVGFHRSDGHPHPAYADARSLSAPHELLAGNIPASTPNLHHLSRRSRAPALDDRNAPKWLIGFHRIKRSDWAATADRTAPK